MELFPDLAKTHSSEMREKNLYWQEASRAYQDRAAEYNNWFKDNSSLFAMELAAIKSLAITPEHPSLEIGVGPGYFAAELAIDYGIDPAPAPLFKAVARGIKVCIAIGEQLPFASQSLASVYILFTECFFRAPETVFAECRRVLRKEGCLILGFVPATSSWGKGLAEKRRRGDTFYRHAIFRSPEEITGMLVNCRLKIVGGSSILFQPPGENLREEVPKKGAFDEAGFVVLVVKPA